MKTKKNTAFYTNNIVRVAGGTALLVLIPVFARLPWGILDYVFMAALIGGTGLALLWIRTHVDRRYSIAAGIFVLGLAFLIWAELAVDLVSSIF